MQRESISFALAGIFFGFVLGYVLAFQIHAPRVRPGAPRTADALPGQGEEIDREAMMGRITDRIEHLQEHVTKNPSDPIPLLEIGDLYFQAHKFDEAVTYLEKALEAAPRDLDIRTAVGEYWFQLGRVDAARKLFRGSVEIDPDHAESWLNLGVAIFALEHDQEAAEEAFAQVDRIRPGDPQLEQIRRQIAEMQSPVGEGLR